ncbi:MAG TPA: hypothetical protein VGF18_09545 [Candidatus Tumulicola sp.]|jgi:hypothetical protein
MSLTSSRARSAKVSSAQVGSPEDAERITVNLAADISEKLHASAGRYRVSESSIVEIALREMFRRISPSSLESFLLENGGCLRRRRT